MNDDTNATCGDRIAGICDAPHPGGEGLAPMLRALGLGIGTGRLSDTLGSCRRRPRRRFGAAALPALALLAFAWIAIAPPAAATHLRDASEAELARAFERLHRTLPTLRRRIPIAASPAPRVLPRAVEALPAEVEALLEAGSALSLLYYDGRAVRHDWRRGDIAEDLPLYGASMSKSITSVLLGHALCEGLVRSLDRRIEDHVPELAGTFYGRARIGDALDMASGDRMLYADGARRGGKATNREYNFPVMRRGVGVVEALRGFRARQPAARAFAYRNANTDAIALVVDRAAGGLGRFAGRALARDAGFARPAFYLADRDGAALAFAFFYATRMDWLRAAVRIGERAAEPGCVGDYLRRAVSDPVAVNLDRLPWRRYGRFFWSDRRRSERRHLAMLGHGGQQGFIGLDDGRVLLLHAIRADYRPWRIFRLLFE